MLLNEARDEALRWTFRKGWPIKWQGPTFNAKNNEVAIETLEIAVEDLVIEAGIDLQLLVGDLEP